MKKYGLFAIVLIAALSLAGSPATADDYDTDTPGMESGRMPATEGGTIPGSTQDERKPASDDDGQLEATDDTGAIDSPGPGRDEEPVVVPGSASPAPDMKKSDELEAATDVPTHGGERDKTGGYDAKGPIQMDGDAEASASTGDIGLDYESPLHQRNLQEAMDPKNARFKSKSAGETAD